MKPGGKYAKSPQYRSLLNCYVKSMLNLIDQIPFLAKANDHIWSEYSPYLHKTYFAHNIMPR